MDKQTFIVEGIEVKMFETSFQIKGIAKFLYFGRKVNEEDLLMIKAMFIIAKNQLRNEISVNLHKQEILL